VMDDDLIEVSKKNTMRIIMRVQRSVNRLYKIQLNAIEPVCLLSNVSDQSCLGFGMAGLAMSIFSQLECW
jgi:hypothetical protein